MTMKGKKRALLAAVVIALGAVAATLLPMLASSDADTVREIRLVARDMRFYLDGQDEPNPMIRLRAGERVRFVLRNDDAGMRHDFAVKGWTVGTRLLADRGEEDAIVIDVPNERGTQPYHCTPHTRMMSGTLRIE
jgi:hypothetical protein